MISKKEVEHIANLARIELTEAETEKFVHELSAVLKFVEELRAVDTEGVAPMTGGTTIENVMRPDALVNGDLEERSASLLEAAPGKKERWIKVRSVFQ